MCAGARVCFVLCVMVVVVVVGGEHEGSAWVGEESLSVRAVCRVGYLVLGGFFVWDKAQGALFPPPRPAQPALCRATLVG